MMPDWMTPPARALLVALMGLLMLQAFGWWPFNDTDIESTPVLVEWSPRVDTTWEAVARCELGTRTDPSTRLDQLESEYGETPDPRVLISTTEDGADCLDRKYP